MMTTAATAIAAQMSTIAAQPRPPRDGDGGALQPRHLRRVGLLAPDVAQPVEVEIAHSPCSSMDFSAVLARDNRNAKALGAMSSIWAISP